MTPAQTQILNTATFYGLPIAMHVTALRHITNDERNGLITDLRNGERIPDPDAEAEMTAADWRALKQRLTSRGWTFEWQPHRMGTQWTATKHDVTAVTFSDDYPTRLLLTVANCQREMDQNKQTPGAQ